MEPTELHQLFQLALGHHRAGRLAEAERVYRHILAVNPEHAGVLSLLGGVAHQTGRDAEAIDFLRRSLKINPLDFGAWHNLGEVLRKSSRPAEALECYRHALSHKGDFAPAYEHLGMALMDLGRFEEAAKASLCAAELQPLNADYWFDTGLANQKLGRFEAAEKSYRAALAAKPIHASAWNNLGLMLSDQGKNKEASQCFIHAINSDGRFAEAWNNLGICHQKNKRIDLAIEYYSKALELNPRYRQAGINLGKILRMNGRLIEARELLERICANDPTFAEAKHILAMTCFDQEDYAESERLMLAFLETHPLDGEVLAQLGYLRQGQRRMEEAIELYLKSFEVLPSLEVLVNLGVLHMDIGEIDASLEWFRKALTASPGHAVAFSNYLYALHYEPGTTPKKVIGEHHLWREQCAVGKERNIDFKNDREPSRTLRVGFVSHDFRDHTVTRNVLPLLRELDRKQIQAICYCDVAREDHFTRQCREQASEWVESRGMTDEQLADRVQADRIDILVDLSCHSACNRMGLFALKAAPVQASWVGYPGTTGLETIDYRLSDVWIDPPGEHDEDYVEKTYRLKSYWCYDPLGDAVEVNESPAVKNGYVTFGNLCHSAKVNDEVVKTWREILRQVPGSRMMILGRCSRVTNRILKIMGDLGERIEFVDKVKREEYLRRYHRIDVILDTFPYNGPSTGMDALWMGVPVVTKAGKLGVGRGCRSILNAVGLGKLVGASREEFIAIAVKLGRDPARLSALRRELRGRMEQSVLMDISGFARDMEKAFGQMWREWCGKSIEH